MRFQVEAKKYVFAFAITAVVFLGALFVSNQFAERRLVEIKSIESKMSLDILSSETQFALLKESSCKTIDHSTAFSEELNSLVQKLSYMEENLGRQNGDVISLKKYYSLLQIKDYLLVNQVNEKCGTKPITIIYFYSNRGDCADCEKEGYVLTGLREEYPELRIYAFDYDLDLSAVQTMKSIYKIKNTLPALVIWDGPYYGFKNSEDIGKIIPQLAKLRMLHEKAATSTKK